MDDTLSRLEGQRKAFLKQGKQEEEQKNLTLEKELAQTKQEAREYLEKLIALNFKVKTKKKWVKGGFPKRKRVKFIVVAKKEYWMDKFRTLRTHNCLDSLLQEYRQDGWKITLKLNDHLYDKLKMTKEIEEDSDIQDDVNPDKTKLLQTKQEGLKNLQGQIAERGEEVARLKQEAAGIEAEIEMLTQSPNGRDAPLVLTK